VCFAQAYVKPLLYLAKKTVTQRGSGAAAVSRSHDSAPLPPPPPPPPPPAAAAAPPPRATPSKPRHAAKPAVKPAVKRAAAPPAASSRKRAPRPAANNEHRNDVLSVPLPCPYCEAPQGTVNIFHTHKSRCKKRHAAGA
jgi:hypothetical protein